MIAETGNNVRIHFFVNHLQTMTQNILFFALRNNYLSCCTCPDYGVLCEHIFLVSRIEMIPFSVRRTYSNNKSTSATYNTPGIITEDNSQKQEFFTKTRARVVAKMDAFFNKYKNNNASLDDMIDNMTRF
ncbi:hypothetical protein BDC45DRAFT_522515, partial [Circinella umbellata]